MNIKNYTSTVPVARSIQRIEEKLVTFGASDIMKSYDDKTLTAIRFIYTVNGKKIPFELPARVEAVERVLLKAVRRPQPGTKERIKEQAQRTAWKIISEWVEIQLSLILLEQAEFAQVFMPYIYFPERKQTFYQIAKNSNFMIPEKT